MPVTVDTDDNNTHNNVVVFSISEDNNNTPPEPTAVAARMLAGVGVVPYALCLTLATAYGRDRVTKVIAATTAKATANPAGCPR